MNNLSIQYPVDAQKIIANIFYTSRGVMLSPVYKYVSLDFETTGLDKDNDDIIQVGVYAFDEHGNGVGSFCSLLQPRDVCISGLVGHITGITKKELQNAPKIEDIDEQFRSFFDEETIIIGHNIGFDTAFLDKFFPGVPYKGTIDTYQRSQIFVHFVPSFALEVLCQYLCQKKEDFASLRHSVMQSDTTSFHDALYDAKSAAVLFLYMVAYTKKIYKQYPQISQMIKKSEKQLFYEVIDRQWDHGIVENQSIPLLQRSITTAKTMVREKETVAMEKFSNKEQIYIGNMTTRDIATYIAQHKNIICVFSHKTKADIIKHLLHDMGVYGIASLYDDSFFDQKRFDIFIKREKFNKDECNFLCKYLSHHYQGIGILDIQQEHEKKIIYFLQETKPTHNPPIVLATHALLYEHINKYPDTYPGHTVCFFDQDWRYIEYNNFVSHPYNPEGFLQQLEKIVYTYDVCHQNNPGLYKKKQQTIHDFYHFLQIFIGVFAMDTMRCFERPTDISIQINPPLYHYFFYRTQKLWEQMLMRKSTIQTTFPESVSNDIIDHIDKLQTILSTMVTIDKNIYDKQRYFFVYKETNRYVQRNEFLDVFGPRRILFFSHQNEQSQVLHTTKKAEKIPMTKITSATCIQSIKKYIQQYDRLFIVSTSKNISQSLFAKLCDENMQDQCTLLAENITGGVGKNIFLGQQSKKAIVIGGYGFLLHCLSKRLYIDKICIFFIKGSMEKLLLGDMQRYASK